jgi:hypothetical protein
LAAGFAVYSLGLSKHINMYKYLHDQSARTVYKFPAEPEITEQTDKRGSLTGWRITMSCEITRADNWLENGRWKYATSDYPVHNSDSRYTREQAVSFFRMRHEPRGEEISAEGYERLHREYENEAKSRCPDANTNSSLDTEIQL